MVTNLMVASAMLNCLWAVLERGSVPYSEVYLDVIDNAIADRARGSAEAGRRRRAVWTDQVQDLAGEAPAALPGRSNATQEQGLDMTGSALARQPNPLPNPFRPGNGVPPPYLAGRDRLLVAFEDWLLEEPPLHANWTLTGLRGTGKTVLLSEFAARAERAGWLTLQRELGDRHRDDVRFAEAIVEDCRGADRPRRRVGGSRAGDRARRAMAASQADQRGRGERRSLVYVETHPHRPTSCAAPSRSSMRS